MAFTIEQWVILGLTFLVGLFIGMFLLAGGKWKRRYREEARLRQEEKRHHETELRDYRSRATEADSLRHAAARSERRDTDRPGQL